MTHASVGCPAFGDISMLPTTTAIGSQPWNAWERIAHDDTEVGVPGYYTVRFPATGVTAELTATTRTGIGRFRYPRNGRPALFHVRSGASLAGNSRATIQIGEDNTTITGWATSGGFCGQEQHLHGVFRDEVQPAVRLLRHLGRLRGPSRRPRRGFAIQRGIRGVPGRLGGRGADRDLLRRCRRSARKPGGRGRGELRRGLARQHRANGTPRCRISRWPAGMATRWRPSTRRCTDRCCTPTLSTTPTAATSDSTASSTPSPTGAPSTPTSPTGTPIDVWPPCRHCSSRSKPATWPSRWSTMRCKADRSALGAGECRDRP